MQSIRAILAAKGRKAELMRIGDSVTVEPDSSALMPLVIEKVGDRELSVGHYYNQLGDLMSDPEVVFSIEGSGWTPIRLTQHPDIERYDPKGIELGDFLEFWDRNLLRQGYVNTDCDER